MKPDPQRGYRLVVGIIRAVMLVSLAVVALYVLVRGTDRLPTQIVRTLLTAGLCYALYRRQAWARWTAVLLFVIGGVFSLLGWLAHMSFSDFGLFELGVALTFLVSSTLLACSDDIHAYFVRGLEPRKPAPGPTPRV